MAKRKQDPLAKRAIGRFIVLDPEICHGKPTFRGTRILMAGVLEQVAAGVAWETIIEEWRGGISMEAISEAVLLANQTFRDHPAQCPAPGYGLKRVQV